MSDAGKNGTWNACMSAWQTKKYVFVCMHVCMHAHVLETVSVYPVLMLGTNSVK